MEGASMPPGIYVIISAISFHFATVCLHKAFLKLILDL